MSADIEVRNVFNMRGRGAVAIGYLREGTIRVGQRTRPLALGAGPHRVLTLAAVEHVHSPDGGANALGLVFRERPSLEALRVALAPGTVVRFEDDADTDGGTA
jgi:translation elongation factor EF-Tu-like GTPase